jgi:ATP/maltotriose-dependent transcriptional regulator MalT
MCTNAHTQPCDLLYSCDAWAVPLQATYAVDGVLSAAAAAQQEAEAANPASARREDARAQLEAKQAEVERKKEQQRSIAQQVRRVLWRWVAGTVFATPVVCTHTPNRMQSEGPSSQKLSLMVLTLQHHQHMHPAYSALSDVDRACCGLLRHIDRP